MTAPFPVPDICFVGLANLPMLAPDYAHHRAGGAELQQVLLARTLVARGVRVSMVVADYGQPDGEIFAGIRTYKTCRPEAGLPVARFVHPRWSSLWRALRRARAGIYYTSCAGALLGQLVMFARLHGSKVVFRIASDSDCDPSRVLIEYWRDRRLYSYGLRRADRVLAQTEDQQRSLQANFGVQSQIVSPMSEPVGRIRPFAERDIDVLWVGNLRALKRPERLLEVARQSPTTSFHMIGAMMPGAAELYETVRSQAAQLPNVRFHGAVPYQRIAEFFARARVLVSTSEIEGFPSSYLQSWAHGTPVIAFIDPERTIAERGLGSRVASIAELRQAIGELTRDEAAWSTASRRCTTYMASRCAREPADAYLAAFAELAAEPVPLAS